MPQTTDISEKKIITPKEIGTINAVKEPIILVGGCFDILHFGHLMFLKNAKQEGKILVVLLESDEFIKKYKRRIPVHTQNERASILAHLSVVDFVIKLPLMKDNASYFDLIRKIKPSVIAITEGDEKIDLKRTQAKELGAELKTVVTQLPFSSSKYATIFRD